MSDKYQSEKYRKDYSDDGFWNKCKNYAKAAGKSVLELALKMYYSAQDSDTPVWAKGTIYGALGYFISPLDFIPDFTPVLGYSDDLTVLVTAVGTVAAHIKSKHATKAQQTLKEWLD